MFARDTSEGAGSEARGEGRERGNLIETIPEPPDAQMAGGICMCVCICVYVYMCICVCVYVYV